MSPDIEKYLNDEMTPNERAAFERRLAADPELQVRVEQQEVFLKRLKTQMLREKIAAALADGGGDDPPEKTTAPKWTGPLVALLLLTAAVAWYFWPTPNANDTPPPADTPTEQEAPEPPPTDVAPESEPATERLIAENAPGRETAPQPAPQTGVRGQEGDPTDWDQLVAGIWQARLRSQPADYGERFFTIVEKLEAREFTDAYARLQLLERKLPDSDTLHFLKGYCLLEMREGGEALRYFAKLKKDNSWPRDVQWYTVLAHLLQGEKDQALAQAKLIAQEAGHPFREEARVAVRRLE